MRNAEKPADISRAIREIARSLDAPIDTRQKIGKMASVPNKRKAGKEFIGGYMAKDLKKKFKKVAKKETGGDARKMLIKLVVEGLRKRGENIEDGYDK